MFQSFLNGDVASLKQNEKIPNHCQFWNLKVLSHEQNFVKSLQAKKLLSIVL